MSLRKVFQLAAIGGFMVWIAAGRPLPQVADPGEDDLITGSIAPKPRAWQASSFIVLADATDAPAAPAPAPPAPAPPSILMPSSESGPALSVTAPPPSPAGAAAQVDESALRYFARNGDQRRLDLEMTRLRALYPNWQPPKNLFEPEKVADPELDGMWKLYSSGKYADLRSAMARRTAAEPGWRPPAALSELLDQAEARLRITNASDAKQWGTVISVAAATPGLLTCQNVDLLWRLAEAFAGLQKPDRARAAYTYVLANCDKPQERLATVQKAMALLPDSELAGLMQYQRGNEFAPVSDDLARRRVGKAAEDPKATAAPEDLLRVEALAKGGTTPGDPLVLGWYYYRHGDPQKGLDWFKLSSEREQSAKAAEGSTLALSALGRLVEAEDFGYPWIDKGADNLKAYLDIVTKLLGTDVPIRIEPPVMKRIADVVGHEHSAQAAEQLGWYAYKVGQVRTAAHWFQTVLEWRADYEPAAYGLAVALLRLNDKAGARQLIRSWQDKSERIAALGKGRWRSELPPIVVPVLDDTDTGGIPEETEPLADPSGVDWELRGSTRGAAAKTVSCQSSIPVAALSPERALPRAWCLMDLNRPVEAAAAFAVAQRSASARIREDAAYGATLANLRSNVTDRAAVAASQEPQDEKRLVGMTVALLAQQATAAFTDGRYSETIILLNERARFAPEPNDLLVLKGYAYMKLRRFADARRIFEAVARTGFPDGVKGLAAVEALQHPG